MPNFVKVFLVFTFCFLIPPFEVNAADPIPPPPVACTNTANPEFHSLRPYQTSTTCEAKTASFATYCGNNLTLYDIITQPFSGLTSNCTQSGETITCNYNIEVKKTVTIDLSGADLPILGNTEDVVNSQNSTDTLDDAQKVNSYVSWYLNGVPYQTEYGSAKNSNSDLVNFSGPINKLLPSSILESQRIATIKKATDDKNHNQIVVCAKKDGLLGIFGTATPHECYQGDGSPAGDAFRLEDWNQNIVERVADSVLNKISDFIPNNFLGVITKDMFQFDRWRQKIPPLPWDNRFKDNAQLYQKAYNEWRGQYCALVPIPFSEKRFLFCIDLPGVTNAYADLYPYIPLSRTEDTQGYISIQNLSPTSETLQEVKVENIEFSNQSPATLFFSHIEENNELGDILQNTYVGKGNDKLALGGGIDSGEGCRTVDVRSNNGDDLFATQISGDLSYNASFSCKFPLNASESYNACLSDCIEGHETYQVCTARCSASQACTKEVAINLATSSSIPGLDETWSRLVAGQASVFKRISPQVGPSGPIKCIQDIPGSTQISYSGGGVGQNADLKLPHLGGISEYFLKGIQTILRPKNFGAPLISGNICTTEVPDECVVNVSESEVPAKYLGSFKDNFIGVADRWSATCPGPDNNLAAECYNFVAATSAQAGVNPAFALAIWLNETGASNYCASGSTAQDFGINISTIYQDIVKQLEVFLNMAKQNLCSGTPGFTEPMQGWLSRFKSVTGTCDSNYAPGINYYENIRDGAWSFITNCVKGQNFGITWPTDSSCP